MSRPPILSGYVHTPVPGPAEIPSPVPGSIVVPTELPGPTIVATPLPFWIQQVVGILQAEGQIQVQILGVELDASEALRGQGEIQASVTGIQTSAPTQYLRARGLITALAGMSLPSGLKALAGRGAVLIQSAILALPGGTKILGGRGQITATRTGYGLGVGTKTLAGQAAIVVSNVSATTPFYRQAVYQTADVPDPGGQVPIASDTAYPAEVVDNNLVVKGAGTADITLHLNGSGSIFQARARVLKNGVSIGYLDSGAHSVAADTTLSSIPLADGDTIGIWAERISAPWVGGSLCGAVLNIIPT